MKKAICLLMLGALCSTARAVTVTDEFNRENTSFASTVAEVAATIGPNWKPVVTGTYPEYSSTYRINDNALGFGAATGWKPFLINTAAQTLNDGEGTGFTLSATFKDNSSTGKATMGLIFNYQEPGSFYMLRQYFSGTTNFLQLLSFKNFTVTGGVALNAINAYPYVKGEAYTFKIQSDDPYIFNFSIADSSGAVIYSKPKITLNAGQVKLKDGLGGFFCNNAAVVIDDFKLTDGPEPEPVIRIAQRETLYNGIVLPAVWPPRGGNSSSLEPMLVPYLSDRPSLIPIDVGRQLFVDDFLIEQSDLTRTFYQAQKYEGNPVLTPAETDGTGVQRQCRLQTGGAFYDPAERVFKIFYDAGWEGGLALATSTDLLHWVRPNLGMAGGNLLLGPGFATDTNGAGREKTVWLDINATNANERLKLMTTRVSFPDGKLDVHQVLQTSADGRVWSPHVKCVVAEDYTSFFYNPFRQIWAYSIKGTSIRTPRGRCRYYSENRDFMAGANWNNKVYWMDADRLDEPDPAIGDAAQLYCHNAVAYESLMLGMFQIHLGPDNKACDKGKHPKLTELKLGFSRDGFHWQRPDRRAFIGATRREGDWDRAYLHNTAGVCLVMDDKLWFPYCGFSGIAPDGAHGSYLGASIGFATLRRDGFASMDAGKKLGALTTRPITFKGKYLFVNLNAPQGELKVEVLNEAGNVIAPFSAAKCVPLNGDKTKQRVTWQDAETLAAVSGQPVRLRFLLTNGSLFSFWVTPDENGASHGYVAAGGPDYDGVMDNGAQTSRVAK